MPNLCWMHVSCSEESLELQGPAARYGLAMTLEAENLGSCDKGMSSREETA